MTKTRQDNDMTNHKGATYAKIGTKLSKPIRQDTINHENQIG